MARSDSGGGGKKKTVAAAAGATASTPAADGARVLQDRLHMLLSRLATVIDHVKNWPEAKGDDASIHVESTSKLIDGIRQVIASLERVEGVVKTDATLRASLNSCLIPLDLLDLLDSSHLNPDCFSRGLLREALGQLAGLKRRKLALELLGAAVQSGLKQQEQQERIAEAERRAEEELISKKRARSEGETTGDDDDDDDDSSESDEAPPAKKANTATR